MSAFKELRGLVNEIDFGRWIFTDANRNGIYELAKQHNDFQEDGFHPGTQTYQDWAQIVSDYLNIV
jgi:lysophospholipase L1-like esterase